ncbi:response regulator receiver modulated metal dependent phosphohydrolase [Candidatus Moduliflexus flocculans]|uniref:Response regulator receiver modulated metal dependent phosphohydrolase n=1 Tax=Candidatus Moduliflexus flocculans TaxID=1499966 RepID=A0A081BRL2_9BACT|nr:response regulator receiver modulated metal dependent phosphohydrolase [Candidatus Moduliflexus flocculans]
MATILVVEDMPENIRLLFTMLEDAGFRVLISQNGESAFERASFAQPDLILLDVMMSGAYDGFETCARLKALPETRQIPVIFMTSLAETSEKIRGFQVGAVDYITKPFEPEEVLARVKTHLTIQQLQNDLCEKNQELQIKNEMLADHEVHLTALVEAKTRKIENITLALINALEHANFLKDNETGNHIRRVGEFSALLAEKYGCDREFVRRIKLYAPLHDVGKIGMPDAILNKTGQFTPDDMQQMQQHVIYGGKLLTSDEIDPMAANIALYHHEKWDGSGYVNHLVGEAIPLEARIVALADVYDALSSQRVYKPAFSDEVSSRIIANEAGKHFDPAFVQLFFAYKAEFEALRARLS